MRSKVGGGGGEEGGWGRVDDGFEKLNDSCCAEGVADEGYFTRFLDLKAVGEGAETRRCCSTIARVGTGEVHNLAPLINLHQRGMRSRKLPAPDPQLVVTVGVPFGAALVAELAVGNAFCVVEGGGLGADEGDRGRAVAVVERDGDDAVGG